MRLRSSFEPWPIDPSPLRPVGRLVFVPLLKSAIPPRAGSAAAFVTKGAVRIDMEHGKSQPMANHHASIGSTIYIGIFSFQINMPFNCLHWMSYSMGMFDRCAKRRGSDSAQAHQKHAQKRTTHIHVHRKNIKLTQYQHMWVN